ncbi:hypothetical protein Cyagr_0738 [Cyanobium gracile PCC 6307]|uniref:Uncharacterized protein n=1 Tax=Cyanobium gracile (strain ATCC 27147 / PCC 6307) TaxID=292564 RepID=K9P5F0_CYAGP|nr:hypothetical protein Cyagr_0738 [Cyanobium gracile PCC 6307]
MGWPLDAVDPYRRWMVGASMTAVVPETTVKPDAVPRLLDRSGTEGSR